MRILLVDDERTHLHHLAHALGRLRPAWTLVPAVDGTEAVERLRQERFDALVTDIGMPGMDGLSLLARVRRDPLQADLLIILATARDDRDSHRAGMTAGADDYLTKPFTAGELVAAIEARLRRASLSGGESRALRASLESTLTARELEVLVHIARGLGSKEIAAALAISPRTVDVHRTNLMRKVDLHNAATLTGLALRAGLA